MKQLLNKSEFLWMLALVFASVLTLSSCNKDKLDIQQNYPFEVKAMPVPGSLAKGQIIEIRITIQREGNFKNTRYFIRYFQYDGLGTLRYYNEAPYSPNDLYPLPAETFRLYYTSHSSEAHSFDVWISDNFGNERKLGFEFSNRD